MMMLPLYPNNKISNAFASLRSNAYLISFAYENNNDNVNADKKQRAYVISNEIFFAYANEGSRF